MQRERGQSKGQRNGKPKNLNKSKKGHKKTKEIKKNTSPNMKASYMYTKPTQKSNHYILEKKKNGNVVAHVMGWRTYGWNRPIWVPKDIIHTMDGSQKVWIPKT